MARGNDQASGAATAARGISDTAAGNAGALYGTLAPQLESEAANPAGFAPTDLARMDTATQQSAGGTQAAATGAGGLIAARSRNAGAPMAAVAKAARTGGEIASEGALSTQIKNAGLKESQRRSALAGMGNLFDTTSGTSVKSLGEVASNINADTNAENASWNWTKGLDSIANLMNSGASAYKAGGCWIAEAIYGVDDPRTLLVRGWLNGTFRETRRGAAVMNVYLAIGRQVAWFVRRSSILRRALTPLFDRALVRARLEELCK